MVDNPTELFVRVFVHPGQAADFPMGSVSPQHMENFAGPVALVVQKKTNQSAPVILTQTTGNVVSVPACLFHHIGDDAENTFWEEVFDVTWELVKRAGQELRTIHGFDEDDLLRGFRVEFGRRRGRTITEEEILFFGRGREYVAVCRPQHGMVMAVFDQPTLEHGVVRTVTARLGFSVLNHQDVAYGVVGQ